VYVEAESRKIGSLQLPTALIETMRAGECVHIEATLDARVDFLLRDYDYFLTAPEWLTLACNPAHLQGTETILRWRDHARAGRWRQLVAELLQLHYDPLYSRSQNQNYAGFGAPTKLSTDDLTPAGIEALAQRVCGQMIIGPRFRPERRGCSDRRH
jgi:tRNA 2-selenouridine synthase